MTNPFDAQLERIEQQVLDLESANSLWITGVVGTGKTATLLALSERLAERHLVPILVAPPAQQTDTACIALSHRIGWRR